MDDLLGEFVAECFESILAMDSELILFERNPTDPEPIAGILRTLHTIKGSCGFLGLKRLEAVAHAAETIVDEFRVDELAVNDKTAALVLQAFDRLEFILEHLETTQTEPEGDDRELIERLNAVAEGGWLQVSDLHLVADDEAARGNFRRLNNISSKLQKRDKKTSMRPVGDAWNRLPSLVRELSLQLGKPIVLKITGTDIELDREIVDLVKDPLLHMVRNSADHGLEPPEQRKQAGKAEAGSIILIAFLDDRNVIFQISDDGQGLDCQRIRQRARATGLMTDTEFAGLSDRQVMHFIFKAGFSTASSLSSLSGRGIGMDVVRANIEKLGGAIEVESESGKGTVFTIRIPLRPAKSQGLVVTCD